MDSKFLLSIRGISLVLRAIPQFYLLIIFDADVAIKLILTLAVIDIFVHIFGIDLSHSFAHIFSWSKYQTVNQKQKSLITFMFLIIYSSFLGLVTLFIGNLFRLEVINNVFFISLIASEIAVVEFIRYSWIANKPIHTTFLDLAKSCLFNISILIWIANESSYQFIEKYLFLGSFIMIIFLIIAHLIKPDISFRNLIRFARTFISESNFIHTFKTFSFNSYINNFVIKFQAYFDRLLLLSIFGTIFATHFSYVSTILSMLITVVLAPSIGKLKDRFLSGFLDAFPASIELGKSLIIIAISTLVLLILSRYLLTYFISISLFENLSKFIMSIGPIILGIIFATNQSLITNTGLFFSIKKNIANAIIVAIFYGITFYFVEQGFHNITVLLLMLCAHIYLLLTRFVKI